MKHVPDTMWLTWGLSPEEKHNVAVLAEMREELRQYLESL